MNVKPNKMTDPTENLRRIVRVEPPPFLYTRIEARITAKRPDRVPMAGSVAVLCGLALLLAVNTLALMPTGAEPDRARTETATLGHVLGIQPSNQLYHD